METPNGERTESERRANNKKKVKKVKKVKKEHVKPKFDEATLEYKLSESLYKKILLNDDRAKKPNLHNWAIHIDRLMRLDKRTVEEVKLVIDFVTTDSFEMNNVLSTSKLRERFPQLLGKAKQGGNYAKGIPRNNKQTKKEHGDLAKRAGVISL